MAYLARCNYQEGHNIEKIIKVPRLARKMARFIKSKVKQRARRTASIDI
jgi:hypothetical protein